MTDRPIPDRVSAIIEFWFDPAAEARWWKKVPAFDREIRRRFLEDCERAAAGALDDWQECPEGCLALVLLLDQLPRNLFRDSAKAFAADPQARAVARHAIARGFDQALTPKHQKFLYMPLMHSEALDDQRRCVELFRRAGDDPEGLKFAERHMGIIERFGRFPHRNRGLGRATTEEEKAFLAGPDSSF